MNPVKNFFIIRYAVKFPINYCLLILAFVIPAIFGCANIVPPSGGEKDVTPPVLLSISPADSELNARPKKIELRFNKFMVVKDLNKNLQLSPILSSSPTVTANGRRVTIKLADSVLEENTTYRIGLGSALTDNRENTPYEGFEYVFSTGAYFDSLELKGSVLDAQTGKTDTAILVALYAATENDTAVMRKKPRYITRVDGLGNFIFKSLPKRDFRMYAIQDANNNYIYDYGEEKIGFLDSPVSPSMEKDSSYMFYTFKEFRDTSVIINVLDSATVDSLDAKTKSLAAGRDAKRRAFGGIKMSPLSKTNIGYEVKADTSDLNKRTFDIRADLVIQMTTLIVTLDSSKVYLSYDNNGIEVEAIQKLTVDSEKIRIRTQWLTDKVYTLRLVKGWAKDSSGNELVPGKYKFRTKGDPDYGSLIFHLDKSYISDSLVLNVHKGADSLLYSKNITDSIVTLKLLDPGEYSARIIIDKNKNGKWDPGVLLSKIQPEKVLNYPTPIVLKAGWDNEVDFNERNAVVPGKKKPEPVEETAPDDAKGIKEGAEK